MTELDIMISKGHMKMMDLSRLQFHHLVWFLILEYENQTFVQIYYDMPLMITVFTETQKVAVPCWVTSPDVSVKFQLVICIISISDRGLAAI